MRCTRRRYKTPVYIISLCTLLAGYYMISHLVWNETYKTELYPKWARCRPYPICLANYNSDIEPLSSNISSWNKLVEKNKELRHIVDAVENRDYKAIKDILSKHGEKAELAEKEILKINDANKKSDYKLV